MGDKVILTHEGAEQFENALNMLDSSLNELRKVADNMLPEKLVNEGLRIYLPEFCTDSQFLNRRNVQYFLKVATKGLHKENLSFPPPFYK